MRLQATGIGALLAAAVALLSSHGFGTPPVSAAQGRADDAERIPVAGLAGSLQNPCFSPDSTRIALTRWPERYNEGVASVHVAELETGEVSARLTPLGATGVNLPGTCWNGPTKRIVFSLERDAPDWPYSAAPDGTGLRRLIKLSGRVAIEPSFAPDDGALSSRSRSTTPRGPGRSTLRTWTGRTSGA
jgi:hypothetical protein